MGSLTEPPFRRIAIVGVGLIGGSIAKAVAETSPSIEVVPIDAGEDLARVAGADLVILSAPVLANVAMLPALPRYVSPATLVTDVSSTKRLITAAAAAVPGLTFIGGHPMAGAARGGAANARADLFKGRPWIFTPGAEHIGPLQRLEDFVAALGGVPHIMRPELHDRLVGAVSHLPQLTASALMHVVGTLAGDVGLEIAGAGLYDTTRLAASPAAIWKDVASTNHDILRPALDALIATLIEMRDSLETGDGIEAIFTSACRWREELDRRIC